MMKLAFKKLGQFILLQKRSPSFLIYRRRTKNEYEQFFLVCGKILNRR